MNEKRFRDRITRWPNAYEPTPADEVLAQFDVSGPARDLLRGAAGCSPYLRDLLTKEAGWIAAQFDTTPETAIQRVFDAIDRNADDLGTQLRKAKRRVALLTALADLGGVWALEDVTQVLSTFADLAVDTALKSALRPLLERGKLPGQSLDDLDAAAGMSVIAMGKLGAGELNYSSDIDLICLFDQDRFDPDDYGEARATFVKATRTMSKTLSDITGEGYVFRVDLRLRPDPAVTPVCLSMEAAERYYESLGRTWERAAYIKARAAAGDIKAGEAFLERLAPFVWRKHLDFAAIEEAHDMRLRIKDHKGLHGADLEGRNIKLASGGIREIEFFTQTRQLIAGGRDSDLRVRETVPGLVRLAEKGWITSDEATQLSADYRAHREVEHRLQMIADQQTHLLPNAPEGFDRLAAFMEMDRETLRRDLSARVRRVAHVADSFFQRPNPNEAASEDSDRKGSAELDRWRTYPALRSDRAERIFERLAPKLLERLGDTDRPEEATAYFDRFLSNLPAGVQLFSLFEANPDLVDLIIDIVSTSPALAEYLSRNTQVFDAVIGGDFFSQWPGVAGLTNDLKARLSTSKDYETCLDTARRWQKEWHFRVGVHHLRGLIDGAEAGMQFSDLAQTVIAVLWGVVIDNFSEKHGDPPGQGAAILAMGSLGSQRLNAGSDLDLIVIYDPEDQTDSAGPRPLSTRPYYARLTQAMITALTAPTAEGRLYEADMRLRPSGRQGPVATSILSFETYQENEAWTWEHLALTRARVVAGPESLTERIEKFRCKILSSSAETAKILTDVADMRARLDKAQTALSSIEAKLGQGRLQDIALLSQAGCLLLGCSDRSVRGQLACSGPVLGLSDEEIETLSTADTLFWAVQSAISLLTRGVVNVDEIGHSGQQVLLRDTGTADMAELEAVLKAQATQVAAIIERVLASHAHGSE